MSTQFNCPKCRSALTIPPTSGGARIQCPRCNESIVAPSLVASESEEDDWLNLDDSPPKSPASVPAGESAGGEVLKEVSPPNPYLSSTPAEPNEPVDLGEDEDPFTLAPAATLTTPTSITDSLPAAVNADDLFADLPSADEAIREAASEASQESFRVTCNVCATVLYAKPSQEGQSIRCSDCYSDVVVPAPPKKGVDSKPAMQSGGGFELSQSTSERPKDPYQKSAEELLEKAAEVPKGPEFTPAYETPDVLGWFKSIFAIFIQPGVILHLFGLSLLIAIPTAVVVAYPVLVIGLIPIALIGGTLTVCCGFAILFGVANQHERIEDWPTVDPTGWFDSMGLVIASSGISVVPAYMLTRIMGLPPFFSLMLVMLSIFVLFPPILLSMLDGQSITTPFSASVSRSVTRCQEDWGAFYFSSGITFAIIYFYFFMIEITPNSVAIGVVLSIFAAFAYFAMIGRLALAISEVVDLSAIDSRVEEEAKDASS
ncbi:MAG: hypothetical protein AAFV88_03380 [Planctomycetota bacterium]